MIAALIASFACAALAQFGISWWRATVTNTAGQPVSEKIKTLAAQCGLSMDSTDFDALHSLFESCPELGREESSFTGVRVYYFLLSRLRVLTAKMLPSIAEWAGKEMAVCSRYVAVMVDQRMARTQAMLAELRSF